MDERLQSGYGTPKDIEDVDTGEILMRRLSRRNLLKIGAASALGVGVPAALLKFGSSEANIDCADLPYGDSGDKLFYGSHGEYVHAGTLQKEGFAEAAREAACEREQFDKNKDGN